MGNFFSKLFGKDKSKSSSEPIGAVREAVEGVIAHAGFDLEASVTELEDGVMINFSGGDAGLVKDREGMLLDSFQIFVKRMLQNRFPDQKIEVHVDCDGFMEDSAQELRDLADKLKSHVLEKGSPSFVRALPPRERKIIHRYLAEDGRVKSQSVGEGFCKKIKISLARTDTRPTDGKHEEQFV